MNSMTPKRHAGTLRNQNVPFQSKNRNGDRNNINNYALNSSIFQEKNLYFTVSKIIDEAAVHGK